MKTKTLILILCLFMPFIATYQPISTQDSKDIIKVNSGGAEEYRMERLAIVVGVNDYLDSRISDLKYAVSDAEKMAKVLEENGIFKVQLYTNDSDLYPTADNIIQGLKDADYMASRGLIKSFVLYYSGHGFEDDKVNYLAPMDIRRSDLEDTGIRLDKVLGIVDEIQENAKVMVFLDACRNDPDGSKSFGEGFARDNESHGYGIFYSTSPGDFSW